MIQPHNLPSQISLDLKIFIIKGLFYIDIIQIMFGRYSTSITETYTGR